MKPIFLIFLTVLLYAGTAYAQRKLDERIPLQNADKIVLNVDDTELIRVDSWDQPDIAITGTVTINANENNEAYQIQVNREAQALTVKTHIENEDSLPHRITVHQGGQDYMLNASDTQDDVVQRFIKEKGGYDWMSKGVQKDIQLQVMIPANTALQVESKFGTVEIGKVTAPLEIASKFGDIDVHIDSNAAVSLSTDTKFGTVYTDLDWELKKAGAMTEVGSEKIEGTLNGGGTPLQLDAQFGNVYLRARQP